MSDFDRMVATAELWRKAAKNLTIRHPDPACTVEVDVAPYNDGTMIRYNLYHLRDTENQDRIISDRKGETSLGKSFNHRLYVKSWPGYEAARLANASTVWSGLG